MVDDTTLTKQDLEHVLIGSSGDQSFQKALNNATPETIVPIIIKYVHFNRLFGAGVASLAGRVGAQDDLFRANANHGGWNDRSMEVASHIFAAAIDEFGDRELATHPTHRTMAQAVIKGSTEYSHYPFDDVQDDLRHIRAKFDAQVTNGYGIYSRQDDEQGLFRSIGFHVGSELLADSEFRALDNTLRRDYPCLVNHLENTKVTISGCEVPAYYWIKIHTSVEADHFVHAVQAANVALCWYSGKQEKREVKQQILEGVKSFAAFQQQFMEYLQKGTTA
ncbi:hypothetical protein HYS47_03595 [Candidatus Woesearchaeota archaeon]|nr:hypothetical protein [Candidatus Woesearchaeota archaeon]